MSAQIFITGATGFVGRHLIHFLSTAECTICGTSFPEPPEHFEGFGGGNYFHLDIRSERDVFEAVERTRPDWIFHLAAVSNVGISWEKRQETMETNLMGTFHLFEATRRFAPDARFLFISSSDVYGTHQDEVKAYEEQDPASIVNPYAFTKYSGELLGEFYARVERLNIVIARPFPHTGPGQRPDFVCSDWASQIAHIERGLQEPVIEVGNLDVRRDFTDARDVVRAYALLMEKGKRGEVYNVCTGKAVSLGEILATLLSFSAKTIKIHVDPKKLRKSDIPLLLGDNKKIREETGWTPEIPLEQSLEDLLNHWRQTPLS